MATDEDPPEWPMPDGDIVKTPEPEDEVDLGAQVPDTPPPTGIDDTDKWLLAYYEHVCATMKKIGRAHV